MTPPLLQQRHLVALLYRLDGACAKILLAQSLPMVLAGSEGGAG